MKKSKIISIIAKIFKTLLISEITLLLYFAFQPIHYEKPIMISHSSYFSELDPANQWELSFNCDSNRYTIYHNGLLIEEGNWYYPTNEKDSIFLEKDGSHGENKGIGFYSNKNWKFLIADNTGKYLEIETPDSQAGFREHVGPSTGFIIADDGTILTD